MEEKGRGGKGREGRERKRGRRREEEGGRCNRFLALCYMCDY